MLFAFFYAKIENGCCGNWDDDASYGDKFVESLWFSFQTFSTIGYGTLSPVGDVSNTLVWVEGTLGILINAVFSGFMFFKILK